MKTKFDQNQRKEEIELLYENIKEKVRSRVINVSNEENLKCELERFGTKRVVDHTRDLLTPEDYNKFKELRNNDQIAIRMADKTNIFVILNSQFYADKLNEITTEKSKFEKIDSDTTNFLKKELNDLITRADRSGDPIKFSRKEGQYEPGYL